MPPVPVNPNADRVQAALVARLDAALPDDWQVYGRRDLGPMANDQWPRAVVVLAPAAVLEVESDNRVLAAYRAAVALEVQEAAIARTDPSPDTLRRTAMQAVYTTTYAGLAVEDVVLSEEPPVPLTGEAGVLTTGFGVTLALLEDREVLPP